MEMEKRFKNFIAILIVVIALAIFFGTFVRADENPIEPTSKTTVELAEPPASENDEKKQTVIIDVDEKNGENRIPVIVTTVPGNN